MKKDIEIDLGECIRCGICVELCPDIFSWSATGFVRVNGEGECPLLEDVVRTCPAACIYVGETG